MAGSLAFVIGFALVFVSFGALFGSLGRLLSVHQRGLEEVFGLLTIGLGFFFAGWWPSSWLQRERRSHRLPRATVLGAGLLGVLFALGWTPCIGPTLGAILGLASSSSGASAARGSLLAFVYCLGLGLPFVVAALASKLIVMRNGKVVEEGPSSEIFARPQSPYTRALFSAAFNLDTAAEDAVAQ